NTAPGNTLESSAALTVSAANGTASNSDYDALSFAKTVTFSASQGNASTQTVSFTPTADSLVEGDETATLAIVNGSLLTGSGQTSHLVTIKDANSASVVVVSGQTVSEDGGPQAIGVRLVTTGGATLQSPLTVTLSAAAGSGTQAGDATFGSLGSFTFAAGSGNGTTNTSLTLTPTQDTLVEGPQPAVLTPTGSGLSGQVSYTADQVTILDGDSATVAFQAAGTSVPEAGGAVNLVLVLTTAAGNTLESSAALTVSAANGTASSTDYDAGSFAKTVTFTAGQGNAATQTVSFSPTADSLVEGDET